MTAVARVASCFQIFAGSCGMRRTLNPISDTVLWARWPIISSHILLQLGSEWLIRP